ncbi:hypothetical protein BN000_04811 [Neobacillus massiliamazoniensis]|jgi:hypothetical protein|uniref:Uncharacterized protein n=1 Tax=Neobacillus massiliamazoniensis TaxID=1499688 RepID=A0A0U1P3K2_9BACI|nr:hypothetical protein BN000_04811 [Neobacillus massiliamazoniensis]
MWLLISIIGVFVAIFRSISSMIKRDKKKLFGSLLMILIFGISILLFYFHIFLGINVMVFFT